MYHARIIRNSEYYGDIFSVSRTALNDSSCNNWRNNLSLSGCTAASGWMTAAFIDGEEHWRFIKAKEDTNVRIINLFEE